MCMALAVALMQRQRVVVARFEAVLCDRKRWRAAARTGGQVFDKVILHNDVVYGGKRDMCGVVRNKLHKPTSNTFSLRAVCAEVEILQKWWHIGPVVPDGGQVLHKVTHHNDVVYGDKRGMRGVVRDKLHKSTSNTFYLRAVCAEKEILQDRGSAAVTVTTHAAARTHGCAVRGRRGARRGRRGDVVDRRKDARDARGHGGVPHDRGNPVLHSLSRFQD